MTVTVLLLLILNLDTKWRKWSAWSSGHFNTGSSASGSQKIVRWVVPRVSPDVSEKGKSLPPAGIGMLDCAAHSLVPIQSMLSYIAWLFFITARFGQKIFISDKSKSLNGWFIWETLGPIRFDTLSMLFNIYIGTIHGKFYNLNSHEF